MLGEERQGHRNRIQLVERVGYRKTKSHLQGSQDLKVLNVAGEVCLHQDFGLGQCFVPATTEQGHAGIAQQGGHQGGVGHCPNAPDTAIITT